MEWHEFKHATNTALDVSFFRVYDRPMTFSERQNWWTSPQGGVETPFLLLFGKVSDMEAVLQAARDYEG